MSNSKFFVETSTVSNAEYSSYFFGAVVDKVGIFKCQLCESEIKKDNGYSNFLCHLKNKHKDYQKIYEMGKVADSSATTLDKFWTVSDEAKKIHFWMRKVVLMALAFSYVENPIAREGCVHPGITTVTLKKHIQLLMRYIIHCIIKPELVTAKTFVLVHDGWSGQAGSTEHYLNLWSSAMVPDKHGVPRLINRLLSCSVAEDINDGTIFDEDLNETEKFFGFTAADLFDMIMLTLHDEFDFRLSDEDGNLTVELTADNIKDLIDAVVSDNCNVNKALCNDMEVPMSGCRSHRLHLAVEAWVGPEEKKIRGRIIIQESERRAVINKIDRLMGEFKTLKNAAILRSKSMTLTGKDIKPLRMNKTRWSGKKEAVRKEKVLRPVYESVENWPQSVQNFLPTVDEKNLIDSLDEAFKMFESVSQALQSGGTERKTLAQSALLFEGLIRDFSRHPIEEFRSTLPQLASDAPIINNPDFENGIIKIQDGLESQLTPDEQHAVQRFLKPVVLEDADEIENLTYAERILNQKRQRTSAYRCTNHILPDSNICERTFSRARLYMNHLRAHMDPKSLEELLFLYFNQELWANDASIIDKAIAWDKREKAKAKAATAATATATAAAAAANAAAANAAAAAAAAAAADTVEDF
jgi:hypothetical protein